MRELDGFLDTCSLGEVRRLILATAHFTPATEGNIRNVDQLLVDLDLSILGSAPDIYDRYTYAIRLEYQHVPEQAYRTGRTTVIRQFLSSVPLFQSPWFREMREQTARANLQRELAKLDTG